MAVEAAEQVVEAAAEEEGQGAVVREAVPVVVQEAMALQAADREEAPPRRVVKAETAV